MPLETSLVYSPFCMKACRITGGSQTGYEPQNLAGSRLPWRANGTTAILTAEFPTPILADTLIMAATNFSFGAQITMTADGVDVGPIDATRRGTPPSDCFGGADASAGASALINDTAQIGVSGQTVYTVGGGGGLVLAEMQVFIDGARQAPTADFALVQSGFDAAVTLSPGPPEASRLHFYAATDLRNGAGIAANVFAVSAGSATYTVTGGAGIIATELEVYVDGLRQTPADDYTVANSGGDLIVTMIPAPPTGSRVFIYCDFEATQSRGFGPRVSASATGDGVKIVYDIGAAAGVVQGALEVYIDGVRQVAGVDFKAQSLGSRLVVTFFSPPPTAAKIYFFADSSIPAAVGYLTESEDWPRRNIFARFTPRVGRVWTITVNDPGNKESQLRALRLIIDSARSAEHVSDGWRVQTQSINGDPVRTLSGAVIPPGGEVARKLYYSSPLMTDDGAYQQMRRDLAIGFGQELFIVLCPDDPELTEATSFLGSLAELPEMQARRQFGRFSRSVVLQELF